MRAVFCELENDIKPEAEINILGERAHHLQVVRMKEGEDLLVLNGKGQRFFSKIISMKKKEAVLKILKIEIDQPQHQIQLAIALPKKEAFEDILKIAVELGVGNIFPLYSEFSQYEYVANERIGRLLESALVQSNNVFLPKIASQVKLMDYLDQNTDPLVYFSASPLSIKENTGINSKLTMLIGPEAGFSPMEVKKICDTKNIKIIHLPTPILRAPTAVATSVGFLLGSLSSKN